MYRGNMLPEKEILIHSIILKLFNIKVILLLYTYITFIQIKTKVQTHTYKNKGMDIPFTYATLVLRYV